MLDFRRLVRGARDAARRLGSSLRILWARILYDNVEIGVGVRICGGVSLRVVRGGRLHIGPGSCIEAGCEIVAEGSVEIGARAFVGRGTIIVAINQIVIGDDALIAAYTVIRDHDHEMRSDLPFNRQALATSPVIIGNNVWIGTKATILQRVRIGSGAVVGAHALVRSDVPPGTLVAGVPAQEVKRLVE